MASKKPMDIFLDRLADLTIWRVSPLGISTMSNEEIKRKYMEVALKKAIKADAKVRFYGIEMFVLRGASVIGDILSSNSDDYIASAIIEPGGQHEEKIKAKVKAMRLALSVGIGSSMNFNLDEIVSFPVVEPLEGNILLKFRIYINDRGGPKPLDSVALLFSKKEDLQAVQKDIMDTIKELLARKLESKPVRVVFPLSSELGGEYTVRGKSKETGNISISGPYTDIYTYEDEDELIVDATGDLFYIEPESLTIEIGAAIRQYDIVAALEDILDMEIENSDDIAVFAEALGLPLYALTYAFAASSVDKGEVITKDDMESFTDPLVEEHLIKGAREAIKVAANKIQESDPHLTFDKVLSSPQFWDEVFISYFKVLDSELPGVVTEIIKNKLVRIDRTVRLVITGFAFYNNLTHILVEGFFKGEIKTEYITYEAGTETEKLRVLKTDFPFVDYTGAQLECQATIDNKVYEFKRKYPPHSGISIELTGEAKQLPDRRVPISGTVLPISGDEVEKTFKVLTTRIVERKVFKIKLV